jgi:hypothetical protein
MLWLTIPLLVVALSVVVFWSILYILFCRSPEKKWRDKVLQLMARARRTAYQEREELSRLESDKHEEAEAIQSEAFSSFLDGIPVSELEICPGIGPATVSKLESAGYKTLASLQRARIQIYGLGKKRLADIYQAVHDLTRQAKSRFDPRACPQAQALKPYLIKLDSKYEQREKVNAGRLNAAESVISSLHEPYALAKKLNLITFWSKNWDDVLPPEVLNQDLLDPDLMVSQAEANAIAALKEKPTLASTPELLGKAPSINKVSQASPLKAPYAPHWEDYFGDSPALRQASADKRSDLLQSVVPVPAVLSVNERIEPPSCIPVLPEKSTKRIARPSNPAPFSVSLESTAPASDLEEENCQLDKLEFSIQFAFLIARLDGTLCPSAKKLIHDYFQEQYASDTALGNRAKAYCVHLEKGPIKFENGIGQFQKLFTPDERSKLISLGERIIQASDRESKKAVALLQKMAGDSKISLVLESAAVKTPEPPPDSPRPLTTQGTPLATSKDDYLRILEIDPSLTISADFVRRQFNHVCGKYASERAMSLDKEFVALFDKKREEIKIAATALLQELGEELELTTSSQPKALRENPDLDKEFGV